MMKNSSVPRVLVVDDEPLIRWSLTEALSELGYEVEGAPDGRSAIQRVVESPAFNVVVLDFRLPDSNDLELFMRVHQLVPSAQIILMTAYGSAEVLDQAVKLGAFRVVHKPFEIAEIASLVFDASTHATCPPVV